MGIQQIKDYQRIIFLNRFVKEILINLSEKERVKDKVNLEKLRQKLTSNPDDVFKQMIRSGYSEEKRKQVPYRKIIPKIPTKPIEQKPVLEKTIKGKMSPKSNPFQNNIPKDSLSPNPVKTNSGESGMKKIEPMLKDISVLSIECPGPGKNLLLKRNNQTNIARIVLSQNEINDIAEDFSRQARIPIVGRILKAAVGNTVISAVISEFVGSRFIINKITPYSLIAK
jgi:hypothetical protein